MQAGVVSSYLLNVTSCTCIQYHWHADNCWYSQISLKIYRNLDYNENNFQFDLFSFLTFIIWYLACYCIVTSIAVADVSGYRVAHQLCKNFLIFPKNNSWIEFTYIQQIKKIGTKIPSSLKEKLTIVFSWHVPNGKT